MSPATRVKCPSCGRSIEWDAANRWRPFCSERCRLVDLGAWLTERHAIPGEPAAESLPVTGDDAGGSPPKRH